MHINKISGNIGGIDILKGREKILKIISLLFIAIFLMCLVLYVLFKVYSRWTENNIVKERDKMVKEQEKNMEERIKNFKGNEEIFDGLISNLYTRENEIRIKFSNGDIKLSANEKEEK